MKNLFYILLSIFLGAISCSRQRAIDELFPWPASGVKEADSLLLLFEIKRTSTLTPESSKDILREFFSLADSHNNNKIIQARKLYLSACNQYRKDSNYNFLIHDYISKIDSSKMPYEWHMMVGLLIEEEQNYVKRYNLILDNLSYFQKMKADVEYCRHLVYLGNLMFELNDSVKALKAYDEADGIALKYNLLPYHITITLNRAVASPRAIADSIYASLRNNPDIKKYPNAYIQLMQNSFIQTDSLIFIDNAINTYLSNQPLRHKLPILLALKGNYYTRHNDPLTGLKYIQESFDSLGSKNYLSRYVKAMHSFKAYAWQLIGEKDSALAELNKTIYWTDSINREHNFSKIYALDARSRIEMAERNASLKHTKLTYLWIISSLGLIILIMIIIFIYHRHISEKKQKEERLEEDIRKNKQSLLAQSSIMEQTNNLITQITDRISNLCEHGDINKATADLLMKELRLHKSNEENRQGFLKVQQELDTRFMTKLKADFPTLSESQLHLASLIAVGVDSRQIGNILNIENASVHTSRWRLRKRLGLSTEDSLEDFLRRYNNPVD
ncbi:MAG: hypothetical protein HDR88_16815 [Bacteroides sp.]|nr:hypothetical protein [Bacteroides sp.]